MEPRLCDVCREPYIAKRLTSRFCSAKCRQRNKRNPGATAASPRQLPTVTTAEAVDEDSVTARSRAKLEAAGRLDTWEGAVALLAADRLDAQVREGGMGFAAAVRAHRESMAEALKGAPAAADGVDELRARRDRRRAG